MPKKLPKGISDYADIVESDYYYVDKTMYIEKLESLGDKRIMLLRPRKFGKSLFVSTLSNYYDILKKDEFEKLFGNTYIGKNPTNLKNSYCVLNFDFSGIDTKNVEIVSDKFRQCTADSIERFVGRYGIEFDIKADLSAEELLNNLFIKFELQKPGKKIYVIIDEYDQFANELLGFKYDVFKELMTGGGYIRKWYEVLKKGCSNIVDRVFITGVAPITLDSLTSGFNIATNLTRDRDFNEIFGFTEKELKAMMNAIEIKDNIQNEILPIMKEYYDGYKFSIDGKENMYNSNICLYFLDLYSRYGEIPNNMQDPNIASDYSRLTGMFNLCHGDDLNQIIKDSISGTPIVSDITMAFNPEVEFGENELISMLFYIGYLTICGNKNNRPELKVPNKVMLDLYSAYFLDQIGKVTNIKIERKEYEEIEDEIGLEGRINKLAEKAEEMLNGLSNRDYIKFDEKYIQIIFYSIADYLEPSYNIKTEKEIQRRYIDLIMAPKYKIEGKYTVMIEFKYLKKEEEARLKEKQIEAKKQLLEYKELDEIKQIEKLKCYTVVAVNDKLYVEEV